MFLKIMGLFLKESYENSYQKIQDFFVNWFKEIFLGWMLISYQVFLTV